MDVPMMRYEMPRKLLAGAVTKYPAYVKQQKKTSKLSIHVSKQKYLLVYHVKPKLTSPTVHFGQCMYE